MSHRQSQLISSRAIHLEGITRGEKKSKVGVQIIGTQRPNFVADKTEFNGNASKLFLPPCKRLHGVVLRAFNEKGGDEFSKEATTWYCQLWSRFYLQTFIIKSLKAFWTIKCFNQSTKTARKRITKQARNWKRDLHSSTDCK